MKTKTAAIAIALLSLALGGCLGDDAGPIVVSGDWARTSPASAQNGAVYMTITSDVDDSLVAASVDPSVAATAEVHETVMSDSGADESMTDDTMAGMGAMTMQEVESIPLPSGEPVVLEPGGYHIMLLDLVDPLTAGDIVEVTLTFGSGEQLTIPVTVRDEAR